MMLAVAVGVVIAVKNRRCASTEPSASTKPSTERPAAGSQPASRPIGQSAKLIEFGGSKCMVCRRMMPILAELKAEYAGRLRIETVDVFENSSLAEAHNIRVIPTQIFFDQAGRELYRHEGFFSKEQIVAAWKAAGVDLGPPARAQ